MKRALYTLICLLISSASMAQTENLKLTNALIVGLMNNQQDRFTLEVALSEILASEGIKNAVALNMLKQGAKPEQLVNDSITRALEAKGINTVMVVSIRGYDRRFKVSEKDMTLSQDLGAENLFTLYKEDLVSVTLEFHFYRNGLLVGSDLLKISNVSDRDAVLKKLRKKLPKRIARRWK